MHLERNLSPAFDDHEPAWGDEDAAPRAESLWLVRARASAAHVGPPDDVSAPPAPAPVQVTPVDAPPAAAVVAEPPAGEDLAWFARAPEPPGQDDPLDLVHDEDRKRGQDESCSDTSWFVAPELAPGTADAVSPPADATPAGHPEFPSAWFPAPEPVDEASPQVEPHESPERAAALAAALARFEAGQPLQGDEPVATAERPSLEPARDVHAWFASPQAFLDTLSAEAAAVSEEPPHGEAGAVLLDACESGPQLTMEEASVVEAHMADTPAVEAGPVSEAPVTPEPDYDVLPAVARWRAAQEASLEAWVAAATRTIEAWPGAGAADHEGGVSATQQSNEVPSPADAPRVDATADVDSAAVADDERAVTEFCSLEEEPAGGTGGNAVAPPVADQSHATADVAPVASPHVVIAAPVVARRRSRRSGRVAVLAAACVAGVAVVATMLVPKPSVSEPSHVLPAEPTAAPAAAFVAPPRVPPVAAPRVAAVPAVSSSSPAWHETKEWTGGRKKSIAFELAAEQPVRTWMRQVTPVLVVRCLNGTLDTFVVTQSASAIEPGRTDHTVRLGFDSGAEAEERWVDSAERDGLFAPDGRAVLARAARSGRLRFTFTPHNAPAAEASFRLAGIESLQAPLTKHCK